MRNKLLRGIGIGLLALLLLIGLLPVLFMLLYLAFDMAGGAVRSIPFDVEQRGVVDVIVRNHHDEDAPLQYFAISDSGQAQEIEAFEAEGMTVIRISPDSLESYIDREKNAVLNRLQEVMVCDETGRPVKNEDPLVERVIQQAAKLEHSIMELRLLQVGENVFLYTELNVNLWCPCELYYYDPVQDRLIEVYTFNELEVVGLRVRDVERLR